MNISFSFSFLLLLAALPYGGLVSNNRANTQFSRLLAATLALRGGQHAPLLLQKPSNVRDKEFMEALRLDPSNLDTLEKYAKWLLEVQLDPQRADEVRPWAGARLSASSEGLLGESITAAQFCSLSSPACSPITLPAGS